MDMAGSQNNLYAVPFTRAHYEVMKAMADKRIIGMGYTNIKKVERIAKFRVLQQQFAIKQRFKKFMGILVKQGLVWDDGKSMEVLSLTPMGLAVVVRLREFEIGRGLDVVQFKP